MLHVPPLKRRIQHLNFSIWVSLSGISFLTRIQENIMENTTNGIHPSNSALAKASDGMLSKASSSAHATVNSIAGAAEEAARKVKPAIEQASAMAHKAVDDVANTAAPAADWLAEQGNNLNLAQKKAIGDTSAYISANPLKSIGIALAAGYLLSKVLK
jgi:ElaB/YqjD/DUF883 family membrane-anchored ribosome-binding protein